MATADDFVNHYTVLGVAASSSKGQIRKAYFVKAKELHPDKNLDNPVRAATLFDAVKKSYDALQDPTQRAALDKKLRAKELREQRYAQADAEKRNMMNELAAKERRAASAAAAQRQSQWVKEDITRLRASGVAFQEELMQDIQRERAAQERGRAARFQAQQAAATAARKAADASAPVDVAVRVKWRTTINEQYGSRGVSKEQLRKMFAFAGPVVHVLSKKRKAAVLVFEDQAALQRAVASPPVGFTVTPVAMPDGSTPLGRRKRKAVDVDGTASGDDDEVMGDATGGGGEPVFGHQAQSKRPRAANSKPSTIDGIPDMDEAQVLRRMMAREARPG